MRIDDFHREVKLQVLNLSDRLDLISFMLDVPYSDVTSLDGGTVISSPLLDVVLSKISKKIPVAYITGRREFYGYEFYVDSGVLIPRVETEILISEAIRLIKNQKLLDNDLAELKVVDLFTGSGVIGITLVNEIEELKVKVVDISDEALKVVKVNVDKFDVSDRVDVVKLDLSVESNVESILIDNDIILANPPYVSEEYYVEMVESLKYEPKIALVSKDNGLFYYNMLIYILMQCTDKKILIAELGFDQSDYMLELCSKYGLAHYFLKDYLGINRVLVCSKG